MNDSSPARILVIDDNTAIHEDFRKILAPEHAATSAHDQAAASLFRRPPASAGGPGVELEFATQGEEGLACVKRATQAGRPHSMAFVDMRMPPGWDGLETIERIWNVQPELLVVICTAFTDCSWQEIDRRLGRGDRWLILKKPFDNVEVWQLARALSTRAGLERKLQGTQQRLVEASRLAGMAEVATGVLHNVGNVLNSVNVCVNLISDRLAESRLGLLRKSVTLLQDHTADLPGFFTSDPKGIALPAFLDSLAGHLEDEHAGLLEDMDSVAEHVEHLKQIIAAQQNYGRVYGVIESLDAKEVIEDALRLTQVGLARHGIAVMREFAGGCLITADRHKVLQILVNLVRNAEQAIQEANASDRRILIQLSDLPSGRLRITVKDTGVGIRPENLGRVFQHGFTTKPDGHGFGLHASVLSAREMRGDLTAHSDGQGRGAAFYLELPGNRQP